MWPSSCLRRWRAGWGSVGGCARRVAMRASRSAVRRLRPRLARSLTGAAWSASTAMGPLAAGAGRPVSMAGLAALARPVPDQVLDRLVVVVGHEVNVAGVACSAHGDVAEFTSAAIGEEVDGVQGGSLAAVHGRGVAVGQSVCSGVVGSEPVDLPVVHAGLDGAGFRLDGGDHAALGGDGVAVGSGGESHDAVPGPIPLAFDDQLGAVEPAALDHDRPGPLV